MMLPCGLRSSLRRASQVARAGSLGKRALNGARSSGHGSPIARPTSAARCYSSRVLVKPPQYGQPYPATHPHLLRETELTSGFPASEYHDRRKRLMESLPEGSVVVCMGGTVRYMTEHIFYKFRQSTDFHYLTGFCEPDATLILESAPSSSKGYKMTLFVPPSNPKHELWEGSITGPTRAVTLFGADEAHSNTLLGHYLPTHLTAAHVFAELPPSPSPSPSSQPFHPPSPKKRSSLLKLFSPGDGISGLIGGGGEPPHLMVAAALAGERAKPLQAPLQRLRTVKSEREIRAMKRAADLSSEAHTRVMRETKPGMSEAQIQAIFEYHCAMGGSERPAYVPVVASGANALVIHYTRNDCVAEDGDLVLIDAGCEHSMYASDITRTYPASGRFTDPQRDLYTAVLNAQKTLLGRCQIEDGINLQELQASACRLLEEELRQIGFRLSTGDLQRKGLYPHYISHHLGSDLHDCATYDRNATIATGNVITVEPGVYVPTSSDFPAHFHGLGVRIEDEVAFTERGTVVLSANAPKEIVDVEGACQGVLKP